MPANNTHDQPQNLLRVAPGVLVVGKPLPWPIYDDQGDVLLAQGYVIQSDSQLEQLYKRGLFYPRQAEDPEEELQEEVAEGERNPFADYRALLKTLDRTYEAISRQDEEARLKLLGLARFIDRICREAPEACLALVHLYSVEPTATEQSLFYSIICHFTARELDMDEGHTVVLMAAALSANLALIPILDKLNASSRGLNDQQRNIIHRHPQLAARALLDAGIDNRLLLKTILQHHERPDGSGYPNGIKGTDILLEAQVLALAEHYVALISRRGYRSRHSITEARKAILDASRETPRPALHQALLRALTPYPPGALVRLANNEVAVVTHRPTRTTGHGVQSIKDSRGKDYPGGFRRDTDLLEFNIRAVEVVDIMPPMDFQLLWGYQQ
ncbi:HD-GYP domain, c-di-GMP phosphodiesterase class II (or its inactivated variant) [Marinobacter daqiaonensis]|uniref:HD-GYP domain, c-di-GMP phosphodiesterase class II (Or its inactivated variant) n=1 Tax=Marinobacter daqiaonensis TaxID=650891 RepID=A0A1I6IK59_9GAMM|nr:HD domain-containing phosphohydrolase [Marinobacter daqiaonensis]SFR67167.1 HD-GYP domain, c-di-GMP phosphodiesterase class II (or its inactivated variant) [Marinobacter daqiaonensis]